MRSGAVKVAFGTTSRIGCWGRDMVEFRFMVEWLGMTPMQSAGAATGQRPNASAATMSAPRGGPLRRYLVVDGDPLAQHPLLRGARAPQAGDERGRAFTNTL